MFGYLLIVIGVVFLFANFGFFPLSIGLLFAKFWPLILIFLGLRILIGASWIGRMILGIGLVAMLFGLLLVTSDQSQFPATRIWLKQYAPWFQSTVDELQSFERSDQKQIPDNTNQIIERTMHINVPVGTAVVVDDPGAKSFDFSAHGSGSLAPKLTQKTVNGQTIIEFTTDKRPFSSLRSPSDARFDVTVGNPSLLTDLFSSVGTGSLSLSLKQVHMHTIDLMIDSGKADIGFEMVSLPQQPLKVHIDSGIASITLPRGVGIQITHAGGGTVRVDGQIISDSSFASENYTQTDPRLVINTSIDTGLLEVTHR